MCELRWPKCFSRNYPKIGHVWVELIASMSWRRRLCDHSCLPSRHHPNEESWKESRLIKTKYREWFKLIITQSVEDTPSGIKWSHGLVSIVHCALCTNPWSLWEFYVGLGLLPWACIKRKTTYNPWRMTSNQGCVVQVQVEHHEEIMLVACRPLWQKWTCEGVPKSDSPIVEYGGAIN